MSRFVRVRTPVAALLTLLLGAVAPAWTQPVRTFFRRTRDGWKLVGLERLAETASRKTE